MSSLQTLDYIVIAIYLGIVTLVGFYHSREERSTEDFFLAGRKMSWIVVLFSVLATEISAMTFIGTPEEAFKANYFYLQFAFGSLIGRFLIAYILLPGFYEKKIDTIYEYLKLRYGPVSHILSTSFFLITRIMASGVRLFAASMALSVATNWHLIVCLLVISFVAAFYTYFGGLKAVMWTDLLQIIIFFGGAFVALHYIISAIPGGLGGIFDFLKTHKELTGTDKLQVFNFNWDLQNAHTFWVSILFGTFMTFAALGADQDLAQRLLTCKQVKESQRAIIFTGFIDFPVVLVFLFIGTSLFVFFQTHPDIILPEKSSEIFPFYIVSFLPSGIRGLLLVGVIAAAMSSLDSALNALASSCVLDIYRPYLAGKNFNEAKALKISRFSVLFIALILIIFAWTCRGSERILLLSFKLVSFTYGAILGIFCLGILTKRGSDKGNAIAMFSSTLLLAFLYFFCHKTIGWSWFIIIGTCSTIIIGALFKKDADDRL